MQYNFRTANENDAPAISQLLHSAMITYCANSGVCASMLEAMIEDIAAVTDRIRTSHCFCYFSGNRAVATITLSELTTPLKLSFSDKTEHYLSQFSKVGYISRFAVSEDLRNEGLGIDLISRTTAFAREHGLEAVLLHSAVSNRTMVEFYCNRGFVLIDHENSRGYPRGLFSYRLCKDNVTAG